MLWFLLKNGGLVLIGFYLGSIVCPRIYKKSDGFWYLDYNSKRGCRNTKKLF